MQGYVAQISPLQRHRVDRPAKSRIGLVDAERANDGGQKAHGRRVKSSEKNRFAQFARPRAAGQGLWLMAAKKFAEYVCRT